MQVVDKLLCVRNVEKRRWRGFLALAFVSLLSVGCATPPPPAPEAPTDAPPPPTFESLMGAAEKARQEGSIVRARESYRATASAFPARNEPWAKLAESYFEANDYGNAILAAQEVLQRDAANPLATSILAVSGLRVSTTALASLRQQESLGADTRAQAEDVVKSLRETLGETVLVPPPVPTPRRRVRRHAPSATPAPAAAAAAPVAPAPVSKPRSPFERLR